MANEFQVEGKNPNAPFTLKLHRGDGMTLIAMNWRNGKPPKDFAGFAIEYREPNGDRFFALKNRIGFPGMIVDADQPSISTLLAPIQKFRWVHFPRYAHREGLFTYRVSPAFMNDHDEISLGEAQEVDVALHRVTYPGKLNVCFTRGFISSQAFVKRYEPDGALSTLIPESADGGLTFKPTHKKAAEAYQWMGFEARDVILKTLDEAIASATDVRVVAYDLNQPEIVERFEKLGPRLKIIIDDSDKHGKAASAETQSEKRLRISAGADHVLRQHMADLQHNKAIAVRGPGLAKVIYGSTNFSWRGLYVQSNNALAIESATAVQTFFETFEHYWSLDAEGFGTSASAATWHSLDLAGIDAKVAFSPHAADNGVLKSIADDIDEANSSVFFSLAFLGQTKKGPIGPAMGRAIKKKKLFCLGISDKLIKAENLGIAVLDSNGKSKTVSPAALTKNVPKPFKTEPSGLSGNFGTRMHHKFVVLDFNTDDARVYMGSYNFSEPADDSNGENLVFIRDRRIATSYMIEALRIFDHYKFRVKQMEAKTKRDKLELQRPPRKAGEKPWWDEDFKKADKIRDRELFA
jgi:hypothetical protein